MDEFECGHVVLTGGEPMLFAELMPLAGELKRPEYAHHDRNGRHAVFAGRMRPDVDQPEARQLRAAREQQPRWHRRHERTRHAPGVMRRLMAEYAYQLKFVVQSPADCQEVERYLDQLPGVDRSLVMLMPQGTDAAAPGRKSRLAQALLPASRLRFCPRRQIEWFGLVRGT